MVTLKLEYSNLAQHQANIFKQLQAFRKEGQLCDVVVKSRDGTEHGAHKAVLCAASVNLRNMLLGSFTEAHQVQQGQPVQIAASDAVVLALLEYIYSGQLRVAVELDDSLELLRLADAYSFPELAAMIEVELCTALETVPVSTALKFLRDAPDLRKLSAKCEKKVVDNFEMCVELDDFLELSKGTLGRILRREDLKVCREEVVVQGLFNWFNRSNDRGAFGALLHNIDFQCLSSSNLIRLRHLSASIGPVGHDLQREVGDALQAHRKRSAENTLGFFRPKRRCLQNWSPDLGASSQAPQKVLPCAGSLCWHDGAIYYATYDDINPSSILRWKPGDFDSKAVAGRGSKMRVNCNVLPVVISMCSDDGTIYYATYDGPSPSRIFRGTLSEEIESQVVAGSSARVNEVNDLGSACQVSVSPEGIIFAADVNNRRLLSFQNAFGNVVLRDVDIQSVFCSPQGAVYVLTQNGKAVEKLVGSTLHPLMSSNDFRAELQFEAYDLFVTKDEVIYLSDCDNGRVLRLNPGEAEPVVVGEAPNKESSHLNGLFVTEDERVYVADSGQRKVWVFHPGDATSTEVLTCPGRPLDVHVQGRWLYVSKFAGDVQGNFEPNTSGIYRYLLAPELQFG